LHFRGAIMIQNDPGNCSTEPTDTSVSHGL
jgi:hypothetical protein